MGHGPSTTPVGKGEVLARPEPGSGAVFSTGSIAYAGALGHQDFANPIARLSWNVLRRFADATPFAMP